MGKDANMKPTARDSASRDEMSIDAIRDYFLT